MANLKTFKFNKEAVSKIKNYEHGLNWPVVYAIENGKEMYIGQTTSAFARTKNHLSNPDRNYLKNIHLISDDDFNISAIFDIESWLIQYISADGKFALKNGNGGLKNHNYFDKERYLAKFETVWKTLKEKSLVEQELVQLRNTDVFKYSPYKALSEDQLVIVEELSAKIISQDRSTSIISGKPGTGKTVLATYLIKYLAEKDETKHLKVALVIPMTPLRSTLKKVFSRVSGLSSTQVIGPADVTKEKYDLLIVDEAHRLRRRVNLPNFGSFDLTNKLLGFANHGTELDWVLSSSKHQIFFYDENQTVRPTDVSAKRFSELEADRYTLTSQMRVEGGEEYINYINDLLDLLPAKYHSSRYDFRIYDDIKQLVEDIKLKNNEHSLARVVAGYAWPWNTSKGKATYDIDIDGLKLVWNSTTSNWVNSPNSINEVGCIHTIQGYDLNYAGVIIGPEIYYDPQLKKICVNAKRYMDFNGRRSATSEELDRYVINIYKTLLTRGIKGTFVYVSDPGLRKLFKQSSLF